MKQVIGKKTKIVAFDFFDTLVHRHCHPEVNLYEWARKMETVLKYQVDARKIYETRKQAEKDLKKEVEESKYSDLMSSVFDRLNLKVKSSMSKDTFLHDSASTEMMIEINSLYFNDEVRPIIAEARLKHIKMIVISDFYFGGELMEAALKKFKVYQYFSQIYVSSEVGVRKSSGNLFKTVIKENHIRPDELVMVGDNIISDYKIPKSLGIRCRNLSFEENHVNYQNKRQIFRALNEISFGKVEEAPFDGYLPAVFFFIEKLYRKLMQDEVKEVSFCSREGQLLKKLFDMYQKSRLSSKKIKTHYFYTSRKATLVASLKSIDSEKFESVFKQYKQLYLDDFLSSLSFNTAEKEKIYAETNLNKNSVVRPDSQKSCLYELTSNDTFVEKYEEKRQVQKKLLIEYIMSLNKIDKHEFNIVDIGWKGTMQDNLTEILNTPDITITGYYLGLNNSELVNANKKVGILFSRTPQKSINYDVYSKDYMVYERIFVANHGPVNGYMLDHTGTVEPIINDSKEELELFKYIKRFQDIFIDDFNKIIQVAESSLYDRSTLSYIVGRLTLKQDCIEYPKSWKVEYLQRKKAKENFGDISGTLSKSKFKIVQKKLEKGKYLFVDYAYKIPQTVFKGNIFNGLSKLYCYIVYGCKLVILREEKG